MKKVVGIIAEYNPFHNGHLYHIEQIKKLANPDIIIAVVSGSFTMRADISIFDKFTKTNQILESGIDLVIELPLAYSMQRADIFADNAVKLLNMLNVSEIWIGSEENNIELYEKYYNEEKNLDSYKDGESYKKSLNIGLMSNDILGYSYYKSIRDNCFNIKLNTIQRVNNNYLDDKVNDSGIASALAIRNNIDKIDEYTPSYVSCDKANILDENKLFSLIKYKILSSTPQELKDIFFCDEGIEYKLKDIYSYNNLNDFVEYLSNKRYSKTRMKRLLIYILLNIKKEDMNNIYSNNISYIRPLGFTAKGKEYIKEYKKELTIYTNIKEGINPVLDIEMRISKLLDSIYGTNLLQKEQNGPIQK